MGGLLQYLYHHSIEVPQTHCYTSKCQQSDIPHFCTCTVRYCTTSVQVLIQITTSSIDSCLTCSGSIRLIHSTCCIIQVLVHSIRSSYENLVLENIGIRCAPQVHQRTYVCTRELSKRTLTVTCSTAPKLVIDTLTSRAIVDRKMLEDSLRWTGIYNDNRQTGRSVRYILY